MDRNNRENNNYFERYKTTVLKVKKNPATVFEEEVIKKHFQSMWLIGLLLFVINVFWCFSGLLKFDSGIHIVVSIMLILYILCSVLMFLTKFLKINNNNTYRYLLLGFYIFSIIFATTLMINQNINIANAIENGASRSLFGVSISTIFLLIIVAFPSPYLQDSLIILGFSLVSLFLPLFLPGKEVYNILHYCILYFFYIIGYPLFLSIYRNIAKNDIKVDKLTETLIESSNRDLLTSILNRRSLGTYCEYLDKDNAVKDLGIIMFDIDFFKSYNDTYSHREGDKILKRISEVICNYLDKQGLYLFRYGGEEFITILSNPTEDKLLDVAKKMNQLVYDENIARNDGKPFDRVTITCGVALVNKKTENYLSKVDLQLYLGKREARNCVVYKDNII